LISKDKDKDKTPVPVAEDTNVVVYYLKDSQSNSYLVREIHITKKD
jgi:hypothetical protein